MNEKDKTTSTRKNKMQKNGNVYNAIVKYVLNSLSYNEYYVCI